MNLCTMNLCNRMLARTSLKGLSLGLMLPLLLLISGCEDLPSTRVGKFQPAVADSVTENGRGGYEWKLAGFDFAVKRPPTLTFMQGIDWSKLAAKMEVIKFKEPSDSVKPPDVDDDVYEWLRLFTEGPPAPTTKFKLAKGEQFSGTVFSLNRKGDRLLTLGKKLHLWNVDDGKLLNSFEPPLNDCKFVSFVAGDDSALMHDTTQLLKISLEDGQTLATWRPESGSFTEVEVARRKPYFAVVDESLRLRLLDEHLKERKRYQGPQLANDHIAIHPDGHSVLAVASTGMVRWKAGVDLAAMPTDVSNEFVSNEFVSNEFVSDGFVSDGFVSDELAVFEGTDFLPDSTYPLAGVNLNRWMTNTIAHEFWQDRPTVSMPHNPKSPQYLLPMVRFADAATDKFMNDWIAIVGSKRNDNGEEEFVIQDISLRDQEFSVPTPLGTRIPELTQANESASRYCLVYEDSLEVIERRAWVDFTGTWTLKRVANLIGQGRLPQFEVCAKLLRGRRVHRNERSGERIYSVLIMFAAEELRQEAARNRNDLKIGKMIDTWYRQGSELALLCSVQRDMYTARSGNAPNEILNRAKRDLAKVMEQPNPPAAAFSLLFELASMQGESPSDYQDKIVNYIELYPLEVQGHGIICKWLLPTASGVEGEANAYLNALVDSMPPEFRNVMYGKTVTWLSQDFGTRFLVQKTGFDTKRLTAATDDLIASGKFFAGEVESLIDLAVTDDSVRKLAEYHYRKFCLPSFRAYESPAAAKIFQIRNEILSRKQK